MTRLDYREVLWVLTPQEDESETCLVRSFSDEAALFETTEEARSDNAFTVALPLTRLVGTRDSKTRWTQDRVPVSDAIEAGAKLGKALPPELMDIFNAPIGNTPLRLKIYSPQPRITDLPWEWLSDQSGSPVALRPDVRLVRCVPTRFEIPHLTIPLPVRVLVVLTNPKDESLLDAYRELSVATQRLVMPDYEMEVCPEPTVDVFKDLLHKFLPHIVHYIGHAGINNGEGNLILHDSNNRSYWVSGAFLSRILPSTVRLMCLSTSVSVQNYQLLGLPHLAHASSQLNLPTMVTNRYPVDQASSTAFWQGFYQALVQTHGDVSEAVYRGRCDASATESNYADWASFSLVLRDRTGNALKIVSGTTHEIENIQATELQAQYAARLANDLAQQVSVSGDYATAGIRRKSEVASKDASDLLRVAGDLTREL